MENDRGVSALRLVLSRALGSVLTGKRCSLTFFVVFRVFLPNVNLLRDHSRTLPHTLLHSIFYYLSNQILAVWSFLLPIAKQFRSVGTLPLSVSPSRPHKGQEWQPCPSFLGPSAPRPLGPFAYGGYAHGHNSAFDKQVPLALRRRMGRPSAHVCDLATAAAGAALTLVGATAAAVAAAHLHLHQAGLRSTSPRRASKVTEKQGPSISVLGNLLISEGPLVDTGLRIMDWVADWVGGREGGWGRRPQCTICLPQTGGTLVVFCWSVKSKLNLDHYTKGCVWQLGGQTVFVYRELQRGPIWGSAQIWCDNK